MGFVDRLFDAVKTTLEMRGDIDRCARQLKETTAGFADHEKRLVRLETIDELMMARRVSRAPRLRGPESA